MEDSRALQRVPSRIRQSPSQSVQIPQSPGRTQREAAEGQSQSSPRVSKSTVPTRQGGNAKVCWALGTVLGNILLQKRSTIVPRLTTAAVQPS